MLASEVQERVRGWFAGRLPTEWNITSVDVTVDREEIVVVLALPDPAVAEHASAAERTEARAGRAKVFREETRTQRVELAREVEHRYQRKVAWGVVVGDGQDAHRELFTHIAAPVMTRLRQPQRLVLDTLVDSGVARSRADALAWCVRLVGRHQGQWLGELREAMDAVADVRSKGPTD